MSDAPRRRTLALLGLLLAMVVLGLGVWRSDFLIDDAYISFRYARNWAEHGVPAYHLDAAPPVEGYSNFLWVAALRFAHGAGWDLESAARVLGVACGFATLVVLHLHLARTLGLPPLAVALGDLTLAAFPPFAVWCTGGLETSLLACLVLLSYALLVRPGAGLPGGLLAGAAGLALALTRVEGFAWVLAVAGCAWVASASSPGDHRRLRFGLFFGVYLAGFGAYLLWRHAVYGEWVANTVHAKAGFTVARLERGLKTTASYLLLFPSALAALALLPWVARGARRGAALGSGGLLGAFLVHDLGVGGDWMPFFRFLAPATPLVAALLALAFARLRPVAAVAAAALGIGLSLLPLYGGSLVPRSLRVALDFRSFEVSGYTTEWQRWRTSRDNLATIFLPLGRALRQVAGPQDALTFGAIGAVGWESNMRLYDINGLVDREVARHAGTSQDRSAGHDKQVPRAWFLDREPTMFHAVFVEGPVGLEGSPSYRSKVALAQRIIEGKVLARPEEHELRDRTTITVHRLRADEGIPEGSLLVVLRAR